MDFDIRSILEMIAEEIDAIYEVCPQDDTYKAVKCNEVFANLFGNEGSYFELSRRLIFNFIDKNADVDHAYDVFVPKLSKITGKFSRKMRLYNDDKILIVQMTMYPIPSVGKIYMLLTEVDSSDYAMEIYTRDKDSVINSTYLFSMYVDLNADQCGSISITELSDSPINNTQITYSSWRRDIVNMIYSDDRGAFLKYTDPTYIREKLKVGNSLSLIAKMMNLEGKFIWVRLIFKRIATSVENDFRFVFMVQDINESYVKMLDDVKKYEELSNRDSLTGIYNHGRIEKELVTAINKKQDEDVPISVFMFDIDFFKNINDIHGHATGDYVLKTLILLVKEYFDKNNTLLGRWGGEEFIGICYGIEKNRLVDIVQALRQKISEYEFENVGSLTCSFGITEIFTNENSADVFDRMDKALYDAKNKGRNCVYCA